MSEFYFGIAGEDEHLFLPVGMHPDDVNKHFGFVTGLKFVMQRSYLICKLVTILSKIRQMQEVS